MFNYRPLINNNKCFTLSLEEEGQTEKVVKLELSFRTDMNRKESRKYNAIVKIVSVVDLMYIFVQTLVFKCSR